MLSRRGVQQDRHWPPLTIFISIMGWTVAAIVGLFVLWLLSIIAGTPRAHAQELGDYGFRHAEFHRWYDTAENGGPLMRPHQPKTRCCDGDCRPTKAIFLEGRWRVWADRGWVTVPFNRMKTDIPPPGRTTHVCASRRTENSEPEIYCFIPPNTEG